MLFFSERFITFLPPMLMTKGEPNGNQVCSATERAKGDANCIGSNHCPAASMGNVFLTVRGSPAQKFTIFAKMPQHTNLITIHVTSQLDYLVHTSYGHTLPLSLGDLSSHLMCPHMGHMPCEISATPSSIIIIGEKSSTRTQHIIGQGTSLTLMDFDRY